MDFKNTTFLLSAYDLNQKLPHLREVAVLGRSNVGKSTLLNALFNSKSLVKTSQRPGKTESINYFLVDNKILFADLPGFGYAKVSKEKKKNWTLLVDSYVRNHPKISLFLLLVDIRREVEEEEATLLEIARIRKIPILIVLTKCDKLSGNQLRVRVKQFQENELIANTTLISHGFKTPAQTDALRKEILHELHNAS